MANCLVVQHLEAEGPYEIRAALGAAGVAVATCRVYAGDPVPTDTRGLDALVVMGGPMSAVSDDRFPSREAELALLGGALAAGLPVLGVCLGAQLLAAAAGAKVYGGPAGAEIGWGPVRLSRAAANDPLLSGCPSQLTVLHWHGDTFDLPPDAVLLASSPRYENQAFRVGERAWGLQFHLEVDEAAVANFVAIFGPDALAAGIDPANISARAPEALASLAAVRESVLGRFADVVGRSTAPGRP